MPIIGQFGVHPEPIGIGVGEVEFDSDHNPEQFDEQTMLTGRVQHPGELLIDGSATLVCLPRQPPDRDPENGDAIDARIKRREEPFIFGRYQSVYKLRRRNRARVGNAVRRGILPYDGPSGFDRGR
jgi:hypothetical protein